MDVRDVLCMCVSWEWHHFTFDLTESHLFTVDYPKAKYYLIPAVLQLAL